MIQMICFQPVKIAKKQKNQRKLVIEIAPNILRKL